MSTQEFLIIWVGVLVTMLLCRCVPIFVLKGRELPERVSHVLSLIPYAAFAALVANDLISEDVFAAPLAETALPCLAAGIVVFVAWKSRSLVWSALAGVAAYAILLACAGML